MDSDDSLSDIDDLSAMFHFTEDPISSIERRFIKAKMKFTKNGTLKENGTGELRKGPSRNGPRKSTFPSLPFFMDWAWPDLGKITEQKMSNYLHNIDVPVKKATFGMACFWAPDALFGTTVGVVRTRVGYTGGKKKNPTYRDLGDHTEAIDIDYDPCVISYKNLLDLFWQNHDPISKHKLQYSSFIYYHDEEQKELAEKTLKEQQKKYNEPVQTNIVPLSTFYEAEDYHQKYRLQQHPWLCEAIGVRQCGTKLIKSHIAARLNGYVIGIGGVKQFNEEAEKLGLEDKVRDYVYKLVKENEGRGLIC
ncbi:methionine sulfoxide reductase A [Lycorma delicatula]|uniref:methionine sulfoxide reductase A n=1 Tax=Lycorma delicatula TaxID=130591 RepID=UPI003F50EF5E